MNKPEFKIPFSPDNLRERSEYSGLNDVELWRSFKNGDERAFILIYKRHINLLFQVGLQVTNDEELIKDCLQDLFVDLRQSAHNLSDTDNIKLYLIKSFRRRIFRVLKKNKKITLREEWKDETFFIELSADEKLINTQISERQLKDLESAMNKLSVKDREIIYYYFYQNLSYTEIANLLDYKLVSSARRSIYKSLHRLRKLMKILLLVSLFRLSI